MAVDMGALMMVRNGFPDFYRNITNSIIDAENKLKLILK
jgi:hypothetical protein